MWATQPVLTAALNKEFRTKKPSDSDKGLYPRLWCAPSRTRSLCVPFLISRRITDLCPAARPWGQSLAVKARPRITASVIRLQRPCTLCCCLRRSSYLPSADVSTSRAVCPLQRAMNMTEDQKRTLRAEFGRTLAGSAQLLAQRETLWRQALGVKIMGTDGRLTERMSAVRTPINQSPDRMQRIPQSDLWHALCLEGARPECYYVSWPTAVAQSP